MAEKLCKCGIRGRLATDPPQSAGICSTDKCDGVEVPPVVGLAAMDRTAIAEEGLRLGVGAASEGVDAADAGPCEPCRDVAGQIEQRVPCSRSALEEVRVVGVVVGKLRDELRPDLIIVLTDQRAER